MALTAEDKEGLKEYVDSLEGDEKSFYIDELVRRGKAAWDVDDDEVAWLEGLR